MKFIILFFLLIGFVNADTSLTFNDITGSEFQVSKCASNGTCIFYNNSEPIPLTGGVDWVFKIEPRNASGSLFRIDQYITENKPNKMLIFYGLIICISVIVIGSIISLYIILNKTINIR